jgi:methanogenic corrinoid protein MtbC1
LAAAIELGQRLALARTLRQGKRSTSEAATIGSVNAHPDWRAHNGERGPQLGIRDVAFHIDHLAGAIESGAPAAFADYASWAARMLAARNIESKYIAQNFRQIATILRPLLNDDEAHIVAAYIAAGCAGCELPKGFSPPMPGPLSRTQRQFVQAILNGQQKAATTIALDALRSGHSISDIYIEVFQASQYQLGRLWEANEISVAEEHMATAITQYAISQVYAQSPAGAGERGVMIIAGVEGELHQVGANMVADMLEINGWDVRFLGTNVPSSGILHAIDKHECAVVGISATMLFNLPRAISLIAEIRKRFARDSLKIIVGGLAFRAAPHLIDEIGADGCATDLKAAIGLVC